ncbi:MAG: phosphatase PAP2 family protein [Desulfomonilaceae bacterium]
MSYPGFFQGQRPEGLKRLASYCVVIIGGFCVVALWYNREIFSLLNGQRSPVWDAFWLAWTTMGDGYLLGVILGCFVAYYPRITALGLATLLLSAVLVQVLKALFPMARPVEVLQAVHVVGPVLRFGSFPSGHAAAGMSVGLTLYCFAASRAMKCIVATAGMLIGVSRIFVGAHFPVDVAVGMLVAVLSFVFCAAFLWPLIAERVQQRPSWNDRRFRAFYCMELAAALGALCVYSPLFAESAIVGVAASTLATILVAAQFRNYFSARGQRYQPEDELDRSKR